MSREAPRRQSGTLHLVEPYKSPAGSIFVVTLETMESKKRLTMTVGWVRYLYRLPVQKDTVYWGLSRRFSEPGEEAGGNLLANIDGPNTGPGANIKNFLWV